MANYNLGRYVGPDTVTGQYRYFNEATGDFILSDTSPSPGQLNAWQAENPKVGTTEQTQSTPAQVLTTNQTIGGPIPVFTQNQVNQDLTVAKQPGAAAPTDDNFGLSNTTSGASVLLNAETNPGSLIQPQPNILDQYASYTYNLGWYLVSPTQFAEITNAAKLDISQWSLLVQSGGAAVQQSGVAQQDNLTNQQASAVGGRNKYFTLDYYMDDLEIISTLGGGGPATLTEISFKVTEPNGITLLPNLTNAVRDLYQETTAANNLAFYVMVVKFYGWDINGHLITDPTKTTGTPGATPGITNAVITRYYPFQITEFNFKMANRAIEYQIKGVPQHFQYASSSGTASIPYNIELTGETVSDVLSGTGKFDVPTADSGRESTNQPSIKSQVSPTALMATGADINLTTEEGMAFNLLSG
jgi:hypothetical protein